ncbi:calcium-responsive transcription factor-like isoform X2 [Oratosquilla oratoria]|uniref:calcium-responsive transcription factor-like isoform X2 n=1 Tax=Oratosquilla oratoria TaxID=337810 RepID=UPI003F75A1B9
MNSGTNEMNDPPVITLDTFPSASSKFHLIHENFGYTETLEDAYDVVNEHIEKTLARFTVWSSSKDFGTSCWSLNNHRIQWEENGKYQGEKFGFDGIPFIYVGTRVLECQYGVDRNLGQKRKWKERKTEGDVLFRKSKKMNCPAKIVLREIVKFPMYRVTQNSEWKKKQMSRLLREAILRDELVCTERRFYVELPRLEDHQHQEAVASEGKIRSIEHVIDERLMSQVEILVMQGMRSVDQLQQHLVCYVENELFANETPPPRPNRKYYPSKKDVRRLAYYARLKCRCNRSTGCHTAKDSDNVETTHLNITRELSDHQAWDCTAGFKSSSWRSLTVQTRSMT